MSKEADTTESTQDNADSLDDVKPIALYSNCSSSVQSRRRAQLYQSIRELAGAGSTDDKDAVVKECHRLLTDMLAKRIDAKPLKIAIENESPLGHVMKNIDSMHRSLPVDRRHGVLALVANEFSSNELKNRWGFDFGASQYVTAKQKASESNFSVEPYKRVQPPSRQPLSDEFRQSIADFLLENSVPCDAGPDSKRTHIITKPIRTLHKEFLERSPRTLSFSTFRSYIPPGFELVEPFPKSRKSTNKRKVDAEAQSETQQKQVYANNNPLDGSAIVSNITASGKKIKPILPLEASSTATSMVSATPVPLTIGTTNSLTPTDNQMHGNHIQSFLQAPNILSHLQLPFDYSAQAFPLIQPVLPHSHSHHHPHNALQNAQQDSAHNPADLNMNLPEDHEQIMATLNLASFGNMIAGNQMLPSSLAYSPSIFGSQLPLITTQDHINSQNVNMQNFGDKPPTSDDMFGAISGIHTYITLPQSEKDHQDQNGVRTTDSSQGQDGSNSITQNLYFQ